MHRLRPNRGGRRAPVAKTDTRLELVSHLPTGGVGAEIGVWKGDFSAFLLEHTRPAQLHLVDPWAFQSDLPDAWYGGASATSQADMDAIHDGVRARFAAEIAAGTVVVHRTQSIQAADTFGAGSLDWVYIDGDHRYEAVRDELARFERIVKPGGIIAGDDYHDRGWWEGGVQRAVDEWIAQRGLEVRVIGTQFVIQTAPARTTGVMRRAAPVVRTD
jgi:hypothetical protein